MSLLVNSLPPVWFFLLLLLVLILATLVLFLLLPSSREIGEDGISQAIEVDKVEEKSWRDRLVNGLRASRTQILDRLEELIGRGGDQGTIQILGELEEVLYAADLGPTVTQNLVLAVKEKIKSLSSEQLNLQMIKELLYQELMKIFTEVDNNSLQDFFNFRREENSSPRVVMIVGVNGAGKTTTIGKIATKLGHEGAKVIIGAGDAFRAAAVDQLQVWADRAGAIMLRGKEGSRPSGVAYATLERGRNEKFDYCLIDTAGRLHTKENLMEELTKSRNVLSKLDPDAPHQVLLVLDAITGQNALRQAEEFNKYLKVTGLIFTKCDSSSKAGSAIPIVQRLKIPIIFIGVGERVEDLQIFSPQDYLKALLDLN